MKTLNEPGLAQLGARLQPDTILSAIRSNEARKQIGELNPLVTSSIWATVQAQVRTGEEKVDTSYDVTTATTGTVSMRVENKSSQFGNNQSGSSKRMEHRQRRALFEYLSETMLSLYEIRVAQVSIGCVAKADSMRLELAM